MKKDKNTNKIDEDFITVMRNGVLERIDLGQREYSILKDPELLNDDKR
jgi:hypothetical protein